MHNLEFTKTTNSLSVLENIERFFREKQTEAYLVGGFVRDTLLGRETADIDVAVSKDVMLIAPELAQAVQGRFFWLDKVNRIVRITSSPEDQKPDREQWHIDLSSFTGDVKQDLARRDFSVDALAVEFNKLIGKPQNWSVIDPFQGLDGLSKKKIHALNEGVFRDDPARLIRAVRLAAELSFSISDQTEELILRDCILIGEVAGEKIREDLLRILALPVAGNFIPYLDKLGLLTAIIPELELSRGVEQPREHYWDVLNHAFQTVSAMEFVLKEANWSHAPDGVLDYVKWSEEIKQHLYTRVGTGSTHAALLKLAALLHDIAKPETRVITDQKIRFIGHNDQGAEATVRILNRLRFTHKEIRLVELMVRYHMRPTQMSNEGMPSSRAIYRYFRDTGNAGIDIIFLSLADHLAARGPDLDMDQWKQHTAQAKHVLKEYFSSKAVVFPPKLLDGHDLIGIFGLKPGPQFRDILERVREAQAAGELISREQALSYIKNHLL